MIEVSLITYVSKPDGALSGLKLISLDLLTPLGSAPFNLIASLQLLCSLSLQNLTQSIAPTWQNLTPVPAMVETH
jgi:hypothetical protein